MILPHYAGGVAAPQALHGIRGIFSFLGKRISPFDPQEKGIFIASEQLEEVRRLPIALPARGVAALDVAIRFAAASIIRCRSAHLVEVSSNSRLSGHSTMRRAPAMPLFRKQSAAEQTSLAPHDSKARLRVVTKRRDSWRSHVHRTRFRRLSSSSRSRLPMSGVEGYSPRVLLGVQGGHSLT